MRVTGFDEPERRPRTLSAVTVMLTAAAGAIDVVTYFAFNQVFASTMTGNLVMLGLGLGQGDVAQIVDNICAIGGYCSGLVAGTVFCGLAMRRWPWRNAVGATLTFELALLLLLGAFWYGVDDDSPLVQWKVVVLVVGSGLAMGVQAAAVRYVGPAGTPTSFMSGTVTNWISSLVELHKPFTWNWNSPLRLLAVIVAAGGNAVVQRFAPDWSFVAPVVLVLLAIVLMAVVTRANSGGLTAGEPQFAPDPREEVPDAAVHEDESVGTTAGPVRGRVLGTDGGVRPAVLTLVSEGGEQVGRVHTGVDGTYRLEPPESGDFMLICTPHRMGGRAARPRAVLISVDGHPVEHDLVLGAAAGESGHQPAPS